jgi:hypothetical protein
MKKSTRRRPGFESLESLMLLSTVMAEAVHAAKTPAQVAPSLPLALSGTGQVTAHITLNMLRSLAFKFSGSAQLEPIGHASLSLTLTAQSDATVAVVNLTLSTKHGKIDLQGSYSNPSETSVTFGYSVIGGTGMYARATGSGTITAGVGTPHGRTTSLNLTFS